MDRWEVSMQVASQTNGLPFDQGTMVIPSGRLPSARSRPVGSSREGIKHWHVHLRCVNWLHFKCSNGCQRKRLFLHG